MSARASSALAIFARPIVAGATKTRLAPLLGPQGAARLYRAFLTDTLASVATLPELDTTLWVAGEPQHPSLADHDLPRRAQPEADLGARIRCALEDGLHRAPRALACGSDAPTLPARYLRQAARALDQADVVLGPSADGGYYAIGVRRRAGGAVPDLFTGVRWSTAHTLTDTLALTACAGLRVAMLPPWYDVDEPADLALLRLHLSLDPGLAPRTRAALTDPAEPGSGAGFDPARRSLIRS